MLDELDLETHVACVELLLGVAHLSGKTDGAEEDLILDALGTDEQSAADELLDTIDQFDVEGFDLEVSAEPLCDLEEDTRLELLRAAAVILDATINASDNEMMVRLAEALELEVELIDELEDLHFSGEEDD